MDVLNVFLLLWFVLFVKRTIECHDTPCGTKFFAGVYVYVLRNNK